MAEFPALPLWTDAYLADTGHLTFEEHGLYLNLIILMWRSPECRIPNDDGWLERRFPSHANALRSLCQEFCIMDADWIWQKRLQKEWRWCKDKKLKNKQAAEARWSKSLDKNHADVSSTQCERNAPIPTPTPLKKDDDTSAQAPLISKEAFEVAKELTVLVGYDPEFVPPRWHGAPYKIQAWLAGGWPREAILTSAKIQMEGRGKRGPPGTVQYFEKGIADFVAQQLEPLPAGDKNGAIANYDNRQAGGPEGGNGQGRSRGHRRETRDDVILAGMRQVAGKMARDRDEKRGNGSVSVVGIIDIEPNGKGGS